MISQLTFVEAHKLIDEKTHKFQAYLSDEVKTKLIDTSGRDKKLLLRLIDDYINKSVSIPKITRDPLTIAEQKVLTRLTKSIDNLVSKDELAQALWGSVWIQNYSEWELATLIYRIRHKLDPKWHIITFRNQGYLLSTKENKPTKNLQKQAVTPRLPEQSYIEYMNNPSRVRKTMSDLWYAAKNEHILTLITEKLTNSSFPSILAINSYSADNVDACLQMMSLQHLKAQLTWTHYDHRALELHHQRIQALHAIEAQVVADDIRSTHLMPNNYDLIINDFRMNLNDTDKQNQAMLDGMKLVIRNGGYALVSIVVDARYETQRYGKNQEKAPIHSNSPWIFSGSEHYPRYCWPAPYYRQRFKKCGWEIVKEFDVDEGKKWVTQMRDIEDTKSPHYRRWLLKV